MLTATFNMRDVSAGVRGMIRQTETVEGRAFFASLKKPIREDVAEHQKEKRGEVGAWPALDPDTLDARRRRRARASGRRTRRRRRSQQRARMLGRLPRAWKVVVGEESIRFVNRVRWSNVHNEGGTAGNGARIPRRQFAYLSRDLIDGAAEIYATHVAKGWRRRG